MSAKFSPASLLPQIPFLMHHGNQEGPLLINEQHPPRSTTKHFLLLDHGLPFSVSVCRGVTGLPPAWGIFSGDGNTCSLQPHPLHQPPSWEVTKRQDIRQLGEWDAKTGTTAYFPLSNPTQQQARLSPCPRHCQSFQHGSPCSFSP